MFWKDDPNKGKAKRIKEAHARFPGIKERHAARQKQEKEKPEERSSFGRAVDAVAGAVDKAKEKAQELKDAALDKAHELKETATEKAEEMKAKVDALKADRESWETELKESNKIITEFYSVVKAQQIPITDENKDNKNVLDFNNSLEKILFAITNDKQLRIAEMLNEVKELKLEDKVKFSKKLSDFKENVEAFKQASNDQIEQNRQKLKDQTIKELYQTLKDNLNDPMWKKHAVIGVPTGVQEMIRVLNGTEKQNWIYRMRHKPDNTEPSIEEMLFRIQKMQVIADRRLLHSSKRAQATKDLYESIKLVEIAPEKDSKKIDESDLKKMDKCIKEVREIKGNDLKVDFVKQPLAPHS